MLKKSELESSQRGGCQNKASNTSKREFSLRKKGNNLNGE